MRLWGTGFVGLSLLVHMFESWLAGLGLSLLFEQGVYEAGGVFMAISGSLETFGAFGDQGGATSGCILVVVEHYLRFNISTGAHGGGLRIGRDIRTSRACFSSQSLALEVSWVSWAL